MLLLTRKSGQKIMIGDDTIITVHHLQKGQVSIGVETPKSKNVAREELLTEDEVIAIKIKARQ